MARNDVDELFGDGSDGPRPRTGIAIALAITGVLLAIVGMACLSAPGGIVVLLGLWWIERELDRVENGYLAPDAREPVMRARRLVFAALFIVILLFVLQALLYCSGFYQGLGDRLFGPGGLLF